MNYNDFLPDAVQWSEGMLLSPQHFQQNDIHAQALLHQRVAGLTPHGWGVRHLVLDSVRLADGIVRVIECDAVMPDGLPLVFREGACALQLQIDLKSKFDSDHRAVRVVLGLPPRAGAMDVPSTSIRRYDSLPGRETLDEVMGMGDVVVERQRAKFELFAGDAPAGYPALPLCELVADSRGTLTLGDYHPPLLRVGASAFLGEKGLQAQFADLRAKMWEKLRLLAGTETRDSFETAAMLGSDAKAHLRAAREIAACLPLIDAVLVDPMLNVWQAWTTMAQIVGRMSSIGTNPRPLAMTPYQHIDCRPQFKAALDFVRRKLAMIDTDWDILAFDRVGDGTFSRMLPDAPSSSVLIELRAAEGQTAAELNTWLGDAWIATEELLPVLRQRRLPGAHVRTLNAGEVAKLGLRPDAMICELTSQRLETAQGMVDTVRPGRTLIVQGHGAKAPAAIILHHRTAPTAGAQGSRHA